MKNIKEVHSKGQSLMKENRDKFTLNKMTEKLGEIMEQYEKDIPQQVGLQLPKLKKVVNKELEELPDHLPEIKLPKLKKVSQEASV